MAGTISLWYSYFPFGRILLSVIVINGAFLFVLIFTLLQAHPFYNDYQIKESKAYHLGLVIDKEDKNIKDENRMLAFAKASLYHWYECTKPRDN